MCLFFPFSSFPSCSALYDNVVVHRVYSELALGRTSKPARPLGCSRGFIRTGSVAVSCQRIVVSFPADTEKYKQQLFSLIPASTPFQFGLSAASSRKPFPRGALSRRIATSPLGDSGKQVRGVKPTLKCVVFFFSFKVCAITFRRRFFFPFPMWQSFLQIVDIPSKIFAC